MNMESELRVDKPEQVPKFSSFRPKVEETRDAERKHRRHDREQSRDRSGRKSQEGQATKPRPRNSTINDSSKASDAQSSTEGSPSFTIDKIGDVKNLEFGSLHAYDIPHHRRAGAGSIIGLDSRLKVDRNASSRKTLVLSNADENNIQQKERSLLIKINDTNAESIHPKAQVSRTNAAELSHDFISLEFGRSKKRKRAFALDASLSSSESEEELAYRTLDFRPSASDDSGKRDNQHNDTTPQQQSEKLRRRGIELSALVQENPANAESWQRLIDFQSVLMSQENGRRRLTNAETKSVADIQLSMYEKAVQNVAKNDPDRHGMLSRMMHQAERLWNSKKLEERWRSLLRENSDSMMLWQAYLNRRQADASSFDYETLKNLYTECIKTAQRGLKQSRHNDQDVNQSMSVLVYLIVRGTLFMSDCGYQENAVATWQALLHSVILAKERSVLLSEANSTAIESFWESEGPRLGDFNTAHAIIDDKPLLIDPTSPFTSWATAETRAEDTSKMPARTTDDVLENDPYRVVLFSDIEDWMVDIGAGQVQYENALLNGFLSFCGLPSMHARPNSETLQYHQDPFIWRGHPSTTNEEMNNPFVFELPSFASTVQTQVAENQIWFHQWNGLSKVPAWQYGILQELFDLKIGGADYAAYFLSFESFAHPERCRTVAKLALKRFPTSLRLYNIFGRIMSRQKGAHEAEKTFEAALHMANDNDHLGSISLQEAQIDVQFLQGHHEAAYGHIIALDLDENGGLSRGTKEKTKSPNVQEQHLLAAISRSLTTGEPHVANAFASILLYLRYLVSKEPEKSISDVLLAFHEIEPTFPNGNATEVLHQTLARLLYHHIISHSSHKPSEIRSSLSYSLSLFPQNSIFLGLSHWHSRRFGLDDRVRDALVSAKTDLQTRKTEGLVSALFAIHRETSRSASGASSSAVLAAFERAVEGPARHSIVVWEAFVRHAVERQGREKAREVFFRALREVPWAKSVHMLAFTVLGGEMLTGKEMDGVWRTMGDKGLRMRVDLGNVLDDSC